MSIASATQQARTRDDRTQDDGTADYRTVERERNSRDRRPRLRWNARREFIVDEANDLQEYCLVHIELDDLSRPGIAELLKEHMTQMFLVTPPESVHALPIEGLRSPDITFWSVWENGELLGCGALKELDPQHGEIKSMRTASAHLRKGVARAVVHHIIAEAKRRGYRRLSLETGSMAAFEPARQLYPACGFSYCEAFGDYLNDLNSMFMTMEF